MCECPECGEKTDEENVEFECPFCSKDDMGESTSNNLMYQSSKSQMQRHRAGDLQLRNCNYRLILFKERTIYAKDRIYNIKPPILFCLNKGVKTQNQS